ncbi:SDR family oxidoreductase [Methylocapsa sp. S129]|uniref:SDR family oxidoreductase n=1 Tax=Methylocapsa sp. S129 TaxID=1641869 RepID=UPI00131EC8F7|nr:SDR family oxidoreductase [Methylocapsa sp. S129]
MSNVQGKVVIITGSSSGIGEASARRLCADGASVMLAARRRDRLEALASQIGGDIDWAVVDVSRRGDLQALAAKTLSRFGRIDAIVNNAGIMPVSLLRAGNVDDWDRMIDVNIKGVLYGVDAVLAHMLQRGDGHIVSISSIAGHVVSPGGAVYSGTKFAVRAIMEGLRQETVGKIRTTIICPGAVATELIDSITDPNVKQRVAAGLFTLAIPPDVIAGAIACALGQPKEVAVNEIIVRPTAQSI